jgi:hypothetical protein
VERERGSRVLIRSSKGAPLLIAKKFGDGQVLQLAAPLDADWSTLPGKNDFVPLLHELTFQLAATGFQRNVDVGAPLLLPLKSNENAGDFLVSGPGVKDRPAELSQRGRNAYAMFRDTTVTGLYRFVKRGARGEPPQPFVVDDDRTESNLAPLTEADWAVLTANDRFRRVKTMRDVASAAQGEHPKSELWWLLLTGVLGLLVAEVAMTRKMVQGGHVVLEDAE